MVQCYMTPRASLFWIRLYCLWRTYFNLREHEHLAISRFNPRECDHLGMRPPGYIHGECDHLAVSLDCAHVYIPESYGSTTGLFKPYGIGAMRLPGILVYVCFIALGTMGLPGILFWVLFLHMHCTVVHLSSLFIELTHNK